MKMFLVKVGPADGCCDEPAFEFCMVHYDAESVWEAMQEMIDAGLWKVLSVEKYGGEDAEKMTGAMQQPPEVRVRIPFGWTPIDYDGEVDE